MPRAKTKFILGIVVLALFFVSQKAKAEEISTFNLDQETISRGYTISNSDSEFIIGLQPQTVEDSILVTIKKIEDYAKFPKNTQAVSPVYEFDLTQGKTLALNKPLNLSIDYNSNNHHSKSIYYFDGNKNSWIILPSLVIFEKERVQSKIWLAYAKVVVLEKTAFRFNLDESTLSKGYTVYNSDNPAFKIGIFPDTIKHESQVILKTSTVRQNSIPTGLRAISDFYTFEFITKKLLEFERPIVLNLKTIEPSDYKKQIYYYDGNKENWLPLPSQTIDSDEVRAFIHLPYAEIVVLEDSRYMEKGYASWYRSKKNPYGAASNDYPYDSILKVTNLTNGKSITVRIVSTGPFVAGRIIDLAQAAFKAIADLYQDGVILVRVEEV